MKFERKHVDAFPGIQCPYETTIVEKVGSLGECDNCKSYTRWRDINLGKMVCSEECCAHLWRQKLADDPEANREQSYYLYENQIRDELAIAEKYIDDPSTKDIIIVVRDQLEYVKPCIESVMANTKNYRIHLWDNGSGEETRKYLESLHASSIDTVELMRSEQNLGFIQPNNTLVNWGDADYIILLNSDTKVFEGWDSAMIGYQKEHEGVVITGYLGGVLDENGKGIDSAFGADIDYVMGWCLCYSRKLYEEHGLFNKQLTFAYCEDADLSLRMKELGKQVYALHAPLVHHYGNKTIDKVAKEGEVNVSETFKLNHQYMQKRWKEYLERNRVRKGKESDGQADNITG